MYWFIPSSFPQSCNCQLVLKFSNYVYQANSSPSLLSRTQASSLANKLSVPFVASRSRWALDGVYELKRKNQGHPSNYDRDGREDNERCAQPGRQTVTGISMTEGTKIAGRLILVKFLANSASVSACLLPAWDCNKNSFQSLQKSTVIRTSPLHCHFLFASSLCWTLCSYPVEHGRTSVEFRVGKRCRYKP